MKKRCLAIGALLLLLAGCSTKAAQSQFFAMHTIMQISAEGTDADAAVTAAEQEINRLDRQLSRTRTESEIYALNHAAGDWVSVSQDTWQLIALAREMAVATDGAYDPTIAPLTDLWGIGTEQARVPAQTEIDEALKKVGYQNIALDLDGQRVRLENGAQLDLGGIAKGYAGAWALTPEDADAALLVLGGNVSGFRQEGYKIGIADPDELTSYLATVRINEGCLVTSGDYERYFEQDGVRYHHIFDPQTGYPAQTDVRSVTVLQPYANGAFADGYSTALFVMGLEKGLDFCAENDIPAVFITQDKRIVLSDAMRKQGFSFEALDIAGYTVDE